jgi:antitoxin (DNA-binding transcriptional repressor) of toxin-antitoxin stability system
VKDHEIREVSATELVTGLRDFLDGAQHRGECFVITRNGRPVAMLGPLPREGGE